MPGESARKVYFVSTLTGERVQKCFGVLFRRYEEAITLQDAEYVVFDVSHFPDNTWLECAPDRRKEIRYYCPPRGSSRSHYQPRRALERCWQHAEHFACQCERRLVRLGQQMDRPPVIVAIFDMELFGHWWHEGPVWLDMAIRRLATHHGGVRLISGEEYLHQHPTNQVVST